MNLIINLSNKEKISLSLEENRRVISCHSWPGLYQLSETLLLEIDKLLKRSKTELDKIKKIKVVASKKSMVSTRIAKAIALGLTAKI